MNSALYFVLPLLLMSQTPHHDPLYKRLQRLYFYAAQNVAYLKPFEDTLQLLVKRYGPYPTIQMYRYGALALKARYTTNLLQKKDYLYTSMASMDAQVARTPNDPEVRFIRGSFYYYLPFFLGKRKAAQDDILTLSTLLETQAPQLTLLYDKEVLRAMTEFIAQTGWVEEERIKKLQQLYAL